MATPLNDKARQRKKALFLENYAITGNITYACRAAAVHRSTFYGWTEHDAEFSAALNVAKEEAADLIEEACRQRAVEGVVKETPIIHNGKVVSTVVETKYSDTLAMFLLNGLRPEKYKHRSEVTHTGPVIKSYAGFDPSEV